VKSIGPVCVYNGDLRGRAHPGGRDRGHRHWYFVTTAQVNAVSRALHGLRNEGRPSTSAIAQSSRQRSALYTFPFPETSPKPTDLIKDNHG
jgi:hypothetical protein